MEVEERERGSFWCEKVCPMRTAMREKNNNKLIGYTDIVIV